MTARTARWWALAIPVVLAMLVGAQPATAQPVTAQEVAAPYVSLGDSFAAGSGGLPLAPGSDPRCLQSAANYSRLVAADLGLGLTDVSCVQADTESFHVEQFPGTAPQLDAVSDTTELVTVMIGGNDNSIYGNLARTCVAAYLLRPEADTPCLDALGGTPPRIDVIEPNISTVLSEVHARAPAARVVIVGYPWLLPPTVGCAPAIPMADGDLPFLHEVQTQLNATIERAARATGTTFVDMAEVSRGHDACAGPDQRWIEPAIGFRDLSILHPNAAGERAIAEQVLAAIGS